MRPLPTSSELITVVLMAASLACLIWPALVRNRGLFFVGLGAVILALLTHLLASLAGSGRDPDGSLLLAASAGAFQFVGFVFLVLGVSGLGFRELVNEITGGLRSMRPPARPGFAVVQGQPPATATATGAGDLPIVARAAPASGEQC